MAFKKSKYLNVVKHNNYTYLYNAFNNAMLKLNRNSDFEDLLFDDTFLEKNDILKKYGFFTDDSVDELLKVEYVYQKNKFNNKVLLLELFPSFDCNLNCSYCALKKRINESTDCDKPFDINLFFDSIKLYIERSSSEMIILNIYGGEPLMHWHELENFIFDLKNVKKNIQANIITNGTLLPKIHLDLNRLEKLHSFQISFDGSETYHNMIRGHRNCYQLAIDGINKLINDKTQKSIVVRINITRDSSKEIFSILSDIDKKIQDKKYVYFYPAFISNYNNNYLNNENLISKYEQGKILIKFFHYAQKLKLKTNYTITPLAQNCIYNWDNAFCVSPDLKLYKCVHLIEDPENAIGFLESGKIHPYSNGTIAWKKHLESMTHSFLNTDKCKKCSWLPICMGGCPLTKKVKNCKRIVLNKVKTYIEVKKMENNNA